MQSKSLIFKTINKPKGNDYEYVACKTALQAVSNPLDNPSTSNVQKDESLRQASTVALAFEPEVIVSSVRIMFEQISLTSLLRARILWPHFTPLALKETTDQDGLALRALYISACFPLWISFIAFC